MSKANAPVTLATRTRDFWWTPRVRRILEKHDIETIGELCEHTANDLMCLPNFGRGCLVEVKTELEKLGFHLADGGRPPQFIRLESVIAELRATIVRQAHEIRQLRLRAATEDRRRAFWRQSA